MTARALMQFITTPASALPSLKCRVLKRLLHIVLIGTVTLTSILKGRSFLRSCSVGWSENRVRGSYELHLPIRNLR
jgi:hypothetical protein